MKDISGFLARQVGAGAAPFLVAIAAGREGTRLAGAAGQGQPGFHTLHRAYSMTKAIGAVAAMIMIERGQMRLDMPVSELLPAFAELQVLTGFDGEEPRFRATRGVCTLAHLATHTSGLAYEHWNADIARWREITGHASIFSGRLDALAYPLVADPGTEWHYGPGLDWLGRAVEAIDGRSIDTFCREEIFNPLGMIDSRFELAPGQEDELAPVFARTEDGFRPARGLPTQRPEFFGMGHALYSSPRDYIRFLRMVLGKGELEGTRILGRETVSLMLANAIGDLRVPRLVSVAPKVSADFDPFPGRAVSHSLFAARLEEDVPGRRAAGSQHWAGSLNTHFWIDPARDVAAVFMTQLAPWSDARFMRAYEDFERLVYGNR
jgi:methyl acetate hydrolase